MSETSKPEWTEIFPDLGASFTQASSDATRRFCEQGQAVAETLTEWNGEISQFFTQRLTRNSQAIGHMTKCQNLPEAFAIQSKWFQDAAEDYLKQVNKLIEANSKIMSGFLGHAAEAAVRPSADTRSSQATMVTQMREREVSEAAS